MRIAGRKRYAVIAGDLLFVLWLLYNGIDEEFSATPVEIASCVCLMALLLLSAVLIYAYRPDWPPLHAGLRRRWRSDSRRCRIEVWTSSPAAS